MTSSPWLTDGWASSEGMAEVAPTEGFEDDTEETEEMEPTWQSMQDISDARSGDLSEKAIKGLQPVREQDRLLPVANVAHLMASLLPGNAKVSRDAKLFMQEIVSEFIGFITSEANDVCLYSNQKAIKHLSDPDCKTAKEFSVLILFMTGL